MKPDPFMHYTERRPSKVEGCVILSPVQRLQFTRGDAAFLEVLESKKTGYKRMPPLVNSLTYDYLCSEHPRLIRVYRALGSACNHAVVRRGQNGKEVQVTIKILTFLSGLSYPTLKQDLKSLCDLGLLEIEGEKRGEWKTFLLTPLQWPTADESCGTGERHRRQGNDGTNQNLRQENNSHITKSLCRVEAAVRVHRRNSKPYTVASLAKFCGLSIPTVRNCLRKTEKFSFC